MSSNIPDAHMFAALYQLLFPDLPVTVFPRSNPIIIMLVAATSVTFIGAVSVSVASAHDVVCSYLRLLPIHVVWHAHPLLPMQAQCLPRPVLHRRSLHQQLKPASEVSLSLRAMLLRRYTVSRHTASERGDSLKLMQVRATGSTLRCVQLL